ncbi:NAD(P)/FAD-dependent oxidoreductase [Granulosicoccus sp. 3-233]|uniref:NAD(P)/FAD-dependent oxidoreductase n=1 Tax=Granulosicoccus sp. 3-233 TaxID=3417969 RepID=UPI003D345DD7
MVLLTDEFSESPLWLDDAPLWGAHDAVLPERVDVLIVGAGYTGLNAAIETARGGLSTWVIDAAEPGAGCSTRNGGQISTSIKPSLANLTRRFGADRAQAIRAMGTMALEWIESRIRDEGIVCDFQRQGMFRAAHTPAHFRAQLREIPILAAESIETRAVSRDEQHRELGTDAYHGGLVYPRHASLHPAKYHRGLLQSALDAGASVIAHCAASRIVRLSSGLFRVSTERGVVEARELIIATNGYSGPLFPWLRRRIIPINSYVMCTEVLPTDLVDRLFPTRRNITDTCKVVYYYRCSPDRQRIVFGGRVSAGETNVRDSARRLHRHLCELFPELHDYQVTHSWSGQVAYTFDELLHTGTHQGIHYSAGYCGSGVSMASYQGMKLGQRVLNLSTGETALDDVPFRSRPFYRGKPWFLPPLVAWYRCQDEWQRRLSQ